MSVPDAIEFIVGNTYKQIPKHLAKTSRSTGALKEHDDIIDGNPEIVDKVFFDLGSTFDPQVFTCSCPIQTKATGKIPVWRFSTRQQIYGAFTAEIKIRGAGGTILELTHYISLSQSCEYNAHNQDGNFFTESKRLRPLSKIKLPYSSKFGIELELTSANEIIPEDIAYYIEGNRTEVSVIQNYSDGRHTSNNWKIVPDSSIVCNISQPDCNKFELVSPPLKSGDGLSTVHSILKRMEQIRPKLKVNKSMGFHVHVDVSGFSTFQLVKVCQQFVKYEEIIDLFMPNSRRTGSAESNHYFQSNRENVVNRLYTSSNRGVHDALGHCYDTHSLVDLMNGSSRYYKLNMQNLVTRRQSTLEFRQHSASMNYEKIGAWVRFCVLFCWNSAKLRAPTPFAEGRNTERKFNALFQFVIKDRALRDFYRKRMDHLASGREDDDCACCSVCS